MRVLIACEFSGIVREAFRENGHDAWSCDLLPTEKHPVDRHYLGDVRDILDARWDLMIAHPPCTHLAVSGAAWFKYKQKEQAESLEFVRLLLNAPIHKIALENPISIISSRIRKPDQIIHPWMFGEEVSKATCLWLKNLPKLEPTNIVGKGKYITAPSGRRYPEWCWKTGGGSGHKRSVFFKGIAQAMADQWGPFEETL